MCEEKEREDDEYVRRRKEKEVQVLSSLYLCTSRASPRNVKVVDTRRPHAFEGVSWGVPWRGAYSNDHLYILSYVSLYSVASVIAYSRYTLP
jgi:hypothetical protein